MRENAGDSQSQPTSRVQPRQLPTSPQIVTQPSLLAPPQLVKLGKSCDPKTKHQVVRLETRPNWKYAGCVVVLRPPSTKNP